MILKSATKILTRGSVLHVNSESGGKKNTGVSQLIPSTCCQKQPTRVFLIVGLYREPSEQMLILAC